MKKRRRNNPNRRKLQSSGKFISTFLAKLDILETLTFDKKIRDLKKKHIETKTFISVSIGRFQNQPLPMY